jgi:hypothetical protein
MRAAVPLEHQTDCGEKRDPDERQRPKRKKENELDLNTQLEKETFAAINTNVRYGVERKNTRSSLSGNAVIGKSHGQRLRSSFSLRNPKFYQII